MTKKMLIGCFFILISAGLYGQTYNHVTMIDSNFNNGQLGGWEARGTESLDVVNDIRQSGTHSLRISNRTTTWHGPIHLLTENPVPGDEYSMSAWIYFRDGPATAAFTFSIERSFTNPARAHSYQNVTSFQVRRGEWTEIKTEFTTGADPTQAAVWVYFELPYKQDGQITANDRIDFWVDNIRLVKLDPASRPKIELDIPNLADVWERHFDIGASVSRDGADFSSQNAQLLIKHFRAIVAENEQKWDAIQPVEGTFTWDAADSIIEFGEMTGMRLRWHGLVWHQQNPAWVFQDRANPARQVSRDILNQRMRTHIQTVMRRYRGRVESYDVVNEPISDRAGLRTGAEGSLWHEILGPDYIDNAFRWAREADPNAQLVINDYNLESDTRKRQDMFNLVQGMLRRGVPVDAVGLQMHICINQPPVQQIRETIEMFASLGVQVIITEMDISIYSSPDEPRRAVTNDILLRQAQRYRDIFTMFREQADRGNLSDMVIIWGTTDNMSWKNNYPVPGRTDAPLLFDGRFQAKPAFWALVDPRRVQGLR
jgi:endo-1,4-beta-xylanase